MISPATVSDIALRAIRANKMRSTLTSLGIIIGVAAVIVMLAIGQGAQVMIQEQTSQIGSNLLMVMSGASTSSGVRGGGCSQPTLKGSDADAIERELNTVLLAAPTLADVGQVVYANRNWATSVSGVDNRMFSARDWVLDYGRMFSDADIRNAAKVAVLGASVVRELFGDVDPLDKTVRIKGVPFEVVGVLKSKGENGMGQDQDDAAFIPLSTAQKKIVGVPLPDMVRMIVVKAVSAEDTYKAEGEITQLLRQRHGLGVSQEDDFTVRNLTQFMEMMQDSTRVMTILLGSIASVSLLVGGIGIMNIMLVSVTERTREIGIRMAIGATARDIQMQFMVEALVLSLIGGLAGVGIGLSVAWAINASEVFTVSLSTGYVVLPFSFSALVGLFFGFYPAYKASKLNPINALRYE